MISFNFTLHSYCEEHEYNKTVNTLDAERLNSHFCCVFIQYSEHHYVDILVLYKKVILVTNI